MIPRPDKPPSDRGGSLPIFSNGIRGQAAGHFLKVLTAATPLVRETLNLGFAFIPPRL